MNSIPSTFPPRNHSNSSSSLLYWEPHKGSAEGDNSHPFPLPSGCPSIDAQDTVGLPDMLPAGTGLCCTRVFPTPKPLYPILHTVLVFCFVETWILAESHCANERRDRRWRMEMEGAEDVNAVLLWVGSSMLCWDSNCGWQLVLLKTALQQNSTGQMFARQLCVRESWEPNNLDWKQRGVNVFQHFNWT